MRLPAMVNVFELMQFEQFVTNTFRSLVEYDLEDPYLFHIDFMMIEDGRKYLQPELKIIVDGPRVREGAKLDRVILIDGMKPAQLVALIRYRLEQLMLAESNGRVFARKDPWGPDDGTSMRVCLGTTEMVDDSPL